MKSLAKNHSRQLTILGHVLAFFVVIFLASWVRLYQLDQPNLYNDEYYQFDTAAGWLDTGEWKQKTFSNEPGADVVGETYTRALPFTWQVAQSMKLFGVNEWAGRLPAALWGILLIPIAIVITRLATKQWWIAYAVGIVLLFDPYMIELSRFLRMYSMLLVFAVVAYYMLFQSLNVAQTKRQTALHWLSVLVCLGVMASIFAELTAALLLGFGIYVAVRGFWYGAKRDSQDYYYGLAAVAGIVLLIAVFAIELTGVSLFPWNAVTIHSQPHWSYIWFMFESLRYPVVGILFWLVGIAMAKSIRSVSAYAGVMTIGLLIYFVFFSRRYEAKRYVSLLLPLVYLVVTIGFYRSWQFIWQLVLTRVSSKRKWLRRAWTSNALALAAFGLLVVPIAMPTIPAIPGITIEPYAEKTANDLGRANIPSTYEFITKYWRTDEVVFLVKPRWYYWQDYNSIAEITMHDLGTYHSLSYADFLELINEAEAGGWIVYNTSHMRHLRPEIKRYIEDNFTLYDSGDPFVRIYRF